MFCPGAWNVTTYGLVSLERKPEEPAAGLVFLPVPIFMIPDIARWVRDWSVGEDGATDCCYGGGGDAWARTRGGCVI